MYFSSGPLKTLIFFSLALTASSSFARTSTVLKMLPSMVQTRASVSALNQDDPTTWLIKSVCVQNGQVLQADPYPGCPAGATIRKINVSEALPYFNYDGVYSEWDNYPLPSPDSGGRPLILDARQLVPPSGVFDHSFRGEDQFDLYVLNKSSYVSAASTYDGGSYNTAFFGPTGGSYDGWISFPYAGFKTSGMTALTIGSSTWQKLGKSFTNSGSSTKDGEFGSWTFLPQHVYRTGKVMDTIQSAHGFQTTAWAPDSAHDWHIETYYFTREYGVTRWEVWVPAVAIGQTLQGSTTPLVRNQTTCGNTPDIQYSPGPGYPAQTYALVDCHDMSEVLAGPNYPPVLPIYPVPALNVVPNSNFSSSSGWVKGGATITQTIATSAAARDEIFDGSAKVTSSVHFLQVQCNAPCNQFVYQDIPATNFTKGVHYAFGIKARSEGSSKHNIIGVALQRLDANHNLISQDAYMETGSNDIPYVENYQGRNPTDNSGSPSSPIIAGGFFKTKMSSPLNLDAQTKYIRLLILPKTSATFDIPEVWMGQW